MLLKGIQGEPNHAKGLFSLWEMFFHCLVLFLGENFFLWDSFVYLSVVYAFVCAFVAHQINPALLCSLCQQPLSSFTCGGKHLQ